MKDDVPIKKGVFIPGEELEIKASRAGGPGGQHVNKASTRITVRWNVKQTRALSETQIQRVLDKLASEITKEGDIIVHYGASRSQQQNKKLALETLAKKVRDALHVPKRRMKTKIPNHVKKERKHAKERRSELKKMRSKKITYD